MSSDHTNSDLKFGALLGTETAFDGAAGSNALASGPDNSPAFSGTFSGFLPFASDSATNGAFSVAGPAVDNGPITTTTAGSVPVAGAETGDNRVGTLAGPGQLADGSNPTIDGIRIISAASDSAAVSSGPSAASASSPSDAAATNPMPITDFGVAPAADSPPPAVNPVVNIVPVSAGAGHPTFNLELDANANGAPAAFINGMINAAGQLSAAIFVKQATTFNMEIGYGEYPGNNSAEPSGGASAAPAQNVSLTYQQVRSFLLNNATSAEEVTAINDLPNTTSLNGVTNFTPASTQGKLWGSISATNAAIDGYAGFANNINSALLPGVALHELTHAMDRFWSTSTMSLFRYTSPGVHNFTAGVPGPNGAYFSMDGGNTAITSFGVNSDPTDFLNSGSPEDSFNEFYDSGTIQTLTALDLRMLDALGFNITGGGGPQPAVSDNASFVKFDGNTDVLFRSASNGQMAYWSTVNGQIGGVKVLGSAPVSAQLADTGDFNGDGRPDLLFRDSNTGQIATWDTVNGQISSINVLGSAPLSYQIAATGDANGDGTTDILLRDTGNNIALWTVQNNQIQTINVLGSTSSSYHLIGVADLNHDGTSDILFRNDNGQLADWLVQGGHLLGAPQVLGSTSTDWHVVGTADFLGNGNTDLLFANNTTGGLAEWILNGTQVQSIQAIGTAAAGYHVVGTGDLNGDGRADIVFRNDAGQVATWLMNGSQLLSAQVLGSASSDLAIAIHHFDFV